MITRESILKFKEKTKCLGDKSYSELSEEERSELQMISLLERVEKSIPAIFQNSFLEDVDKQILDWLSNKDKKEAVYIYGECGTGKTYALYALYREYCLSRKPSKIYNTVELLRIFKKDFSGETHNFEKALEFEGVLFIDDIGAEKSSEFVEETLYHLINIRYENKRPTFFTSNLSLKELAEKSGDRLTSRIAGMCDVIKLTGKDKRI